MQTLTPNESDVLAVVRFHAAGYQFAIEASEVGAMIRGDIEQDEAIESLLGFPPAKPDTTRRSLALKGSGRRIMVSEPIEMNSIDSRNIHPIPALIRCRRHLPGLAALAIEQGQLCLLLEPLGLLSTEQNNTKLEKQP